MSIFCNRFRHITYLLLGLLLFYLYLLRSYQRFPASGYFAGNSTLGCFHKCRPFKAIFVNFSPGNLCLAELRMLCHLNYSEKFLFLETPTNGLKF